MTSFRRAIFRALPLALAVPLLAQQNTGITQQQADQILNELRQIRQLLEKQAKPAQPPAEQIVRAKMNLEGSAMIGNKDAPLTIVEFTDYQCPFCQRFHVTTYADLKKNYIDTGKVRFFSRDMPLDFHANAMRAAQAGRCAGEQGQFWALREVMSANPDKLGLEQILNFATGLKLDVNSLRSCITSEKFKAAVQADVLEAMRIGATGTPAFLIGKSTPEGVDGELLLGAMPLAAFEEKMKAEAGK
jgi:protein-disulfide isomerase